MVNVNESQRSTSDFQRSNASLKLAQLLFGIRETRGQSRNIQTAGTCGFVRVPDEERPALLGDHKTVVTQLPQGVLDGLRRNTVLLREGANRRQSIARSVVAPCPDSAAQVVRHLHVKRPRVVRIDRHPSRVSAADHMRDGTPCCVPAQY